MTYMLVDAVARNQKAPKSFLIPDQATLDALEIDNYVQLGFLVTSDPESRSERMWVKIERIEGDTLNGVLDNDPVLVKTVTCGDSIMFEQKHILKTL